MNEDNFVKARAAGIRAAKYEFKTFKNDNRREFVDEYLKSEGIITEELKKSAIVYLLLKRGILPETMRNYDKNLSKDEIETIFKEIQVSATRNFATFYESYQRKIAYKYDQETVKSAYEDLVTAYHTLRKCTIKGWDCPDQMISVSEMANLYNILTNTKEIKAQTEKIK